MSSTPTRIGRYDILNPIYGGGMATVFRAHDPQIDRDVCIKQIRDELDAPDLRELFLREVRAAGKLRHPNIVGIYDTGEFEGRPYIVMEYIPGRTLAQMIHDRAALSLADRLYLLEQMCDGLACAHRAGIVHRDIKPGNLIVDESGALKVLDFGIARLSESGPVSRVIGTINYMSPEQWSGGQLDRRSDIFSAGAVCYELLSLKKAFPGETTPEVYRQIAQGPPESLETVCPDLDPRITRLVGQMLQTGVEDRPSWLEPVRDEFERLRVELQRGMNEPTVVIPATVPASEAATVVMPRTQGSAGAPPMAPTAPGGSRAAATVVQAAAGHAPVAALEHTIQPPSPAIPVPSKPPAARSAQPIVWAGAAVVVVALVIGAYLMTSGGNRRQAAPQGTSAPQAIPQATSPPAAGAVAEPPPAATTSAPVTVAPRDPLPAPPVAPAASAPPEPEPATRQAPAAAGTAPPRPATTPPARRTAADTARCAQLLEKLSLGEGLTKAENDFRIERCRN